MVPTRFRSATIAAMRRRKFLAAWAPRWRCRMLVPRWVSAQSRRPGHAPIGPPSTITQPPRDFSRRGAPTTYFTDPDVLTVDPAFDGLRQPNAPIQRLWTGALWSEGPAWNSVGRFLVWSDIPNNRQLRWSEDDGHVSVFRMPSNNSNGNTFDFQGRQLSCEHLTRRLVRYELDGSVTVLAVDLQRQAAQLAERCRAASRRQLLVHRPSVWRAALRGHGRCGRRAGEQGRADEPEARPAAGDRLLQARAADGGLPPRQERHADAGGRRRPRARPERPVLLAGLQEALRRQHRPGPGRHHRRAARATCRCSTSARTTSSATASCSATS